MPWWGHVLYTLAATHLTIIGVTLYLHRCQAHRAVDLHPLVSHVLRFWLWITTGMETREWVAVHRKHHAKVETEEDPHSPQVFGIRKVLLEGSELYRVGARDAESVERYSHGCPDDWIERNLYTPHSNKGIYVMMALNLLLLGPIGLTVWAVQMAWIPVFAAGVINGVGHYAGYRKFETADTSTNIVPWGVLIGGEESGGIAVADYLPERDGILCGLILRELVVRRGKSLRAAARSCTTTTTPSRAPRSSRCSGTSSMSAGSTSASCRRSVSPG